jgi:hypothetical protein
VRLTEIDPLQLEKPALFQRFVELLEAKQIKGSSRFELQPSKYSTCVQLLEQNYDELWAYADEVLKYVPTISYTNYFAKIFEALTRYQ